MGRILVCTVATYLAFDPHMYVIRRPTELKQTYCSVYTSDRSLRATSL